MNIELVRCREEDLTKMNIQFVRCSEEDLPKILEIYTEAFPKEERKPFQIICEHNRIGKAELSCVLIDGDVAGMVHTYLFDGFAMVDYFAIHKDKRNLGAGTRVIDLIRKKYKGYKIYLEIEDATIGEMQARRLEFYKRCGLCEVGTYVNLFGVDMELLAFDDFKVTFPEYFALYSYMGGEEFAKRNVKERKI